MVSNSRNTTFVGNLTAFEDETTLRTEFIYDDMNREESASDPAYGTTTSAYNVAGELISWTDAEGITQTWEYDIVGRPTATNEGISNRSEFSFDVADNLIQVDDARGNVGVLHDATTEETAEFGIKLSTLENPETGTSDDAHDDHLALAGRINIAPGEINISISAENLASVLILDQTRIVEDFLEIASPFQHRNRGVETKLIIGDEIPDIDQTLLRNIGRAYLYFDLVRTGKTFSEIAETESASKRRIQQLIELAFLAPDIIRSVLRGNQPLGLTSDWLMRHAFTPIWSEQREQFSAL